MKKIRIDVGKDEFELGDETILYETKEELAESGLGEVRDIYWESDWFLGCIRDTNGEMRIILEYTSLIIVEDDFVMNEDDYTNITVNSLSFEDEPKTTIRYTIDNSGLKMDRFLVVPFEVSRGEALNIINSKLNK